MDCLAEALIYFSTIELWIMVDHSQAESDGQNIKISNNSNFFIILKIQLLVFATSKSH